MAIYFDIVFEDNPKYKSNIYPKFAMYDYLHTSVICSGRINVVKECEHIFKPRDGDSFDKYFDNGEIGIIQRDNKHFFHPEVES